MELNILIIDDAPVNLTLFRALAERLEGVRVHCFLSSAEALAWCRGGEADVVVVDYMMPAPDGIEFIRCFRELPGMLEVPVVMVTANDQKSVRYEALEQGASDFLNKPIDKNEFLARMRNMCALRRGQKQLNDRAAWLAEEVRKATQTLLVRSGGKTFAIPSSMVAQVQELKPAAMEKAQADKGVEWLGDFYSYRYLPNLLGDTDAKPELERFNWLLLLRAGSETLALHVDALQGNQEVVVKNAGPQYARMVGFAGATVLGDGEIILILNPVALAGRAITWFEGRPAVSAPVLPQTQPLVMVVDDSLTVRKITTRLLEREGFKVVTAKDGVDALEQLQTVRPDVIIADIEMPRMDGFDLTRNIRADALLRSIPIIMITSRTADKHKQYAMQIGVNHYLGKPYDEETLIGLIRGFTGARV